MSRSDNKKLMWELADELKRQGWRVELNKHFKAYAPDGVNMVVFPKTPSDPRGILNIRSVLKRKGVNI